MTGFSIVVEIQSPPDRVWTALCDVERWPEWTRSMTSVELPDPAPLALGCRALNHQPWLRPTWWRVTELDEAGKVFVWVGRTPGVRAVGGHSIETIPSGSRVALTLRFSGLPGPLVIALSMPAIPYCHVIALEPAGRRGSPTGSRRLRPFPRKAFCD